MITIAARFPWKRYHATPWGRNVNEGAVELPPSPWRILRALYATWRTLRPDLPEHEVHAILTALAATAPRYGIPPYQLSHTRHYYPDQSHRTGSRAGTDNVIDAFALLGADATLYIAWATTLDPEHTKILAQLVEALPYLGRSESLVEARLLEAHETIPDTHAPCGPVLGGDESTVAAGSTVELLTPQLPLDFAALTASPTDVRDQRLVYPPGTRHLTYTLPPAQAATPPTRRMRRDRPSPNPSARHDGPIHAARLSVNGPTRPPITQTVALTDALRATLVDEATPAAQPVADRNLIGKDTHGIPLTGHQHIHFLPWDGNGDGRIDEILLWIPAGLTPEALAVVQRALTRRAVGVPPGVPGPRNLRLRLSAYGGPADQTLPATVTGPARVWSSVTPFVASRFPHKNQDRDQHFEDEIARELQYRGHPEPTRIEKIPGPWGLHTRHRHTKRETLATARPGFGYTLHFNQPVTGPLALGHNSHFGLGLFLPVDDG